MVFQLSIHICILSKWQRGSERRDIEEETAGGKKKEVGREKGLKQDQKAMYACDENGAWKGKGTEKESKPVYHLSVKSQNPMRTWMDLD